MYGGESCEVVRSNNRAVSREQGGVDEISKSTTPCYSLLTAFLICNAFPSLLVRTKKAHMSSRFLVISGILLFSFSSCRKSSDIGDGYIQERQCEERTVNGSKVTICFNKLLEDSRCPLKAMCIWQGVAKGNFSIHSGNQETEFSLSTATMQPAYNRDTILFGYKIHLVDIKPYPGEGSFTPRAKVGISK